VVHKDDNYLDINNQEIHITLNTTV